MKRVLGAVCLLSVFGVLFGGTVASIGWKTASGIWLLAFVLVALVFIGIGLLTEAL